MLISIADSNHGFWEPEVEECERLSTPQAHIEVKYQNCTQGDIIDKCQGSDIIAVQRLFLDKNVLSQIPSCKVVTRLGVGLDNINLNDMEELGIKVVYFPGFCTEEVANSALSMILSMYRRSNIIQDSQTHLEDVWGKPTLLEGLRCAVKTTIGVLGAGRIGSEVIKRLNVCGFKVIACDPYVNNVGCEMVDLVTLFKDSDIITIHCSLTDETKHMVNYKLLKNMNIGSCVVNTARGGVVVSIDLVRSLSENRLMAAYVDVYDPEPADLRSLSHDRLYITPHTAFYSQDSLDRLKRETIRQSVKVFNEMQSNSNNFSE